LFQVHESPVDQASESIPSLGFAKAFVFLAAFLTLFGWVLSAAGRLGWISGLFFVGLVGAVLIARRDHRDWQQLFEEFAAPFRTPLALILPGFILVASALYTPMQLDSLTYRLPRALLWLEHGSVYHIATPDQRLNYLGHVWELCTAPLLALAGLRLICFWQVLSWVVCQAVYFRWGLRLGQSAKRSRLFALLANGSCFAVLQACSAGNDLMAATLLLVALDFIWVYETQRKPGDILWAGLSLALGTGVKPHFAVLALPFLLWFFLARSQPWRRFAWRAAPLSVPLLLVCSAAMTLILNYHHYGHLAGPDQKALYQKSGPVNNVLAGTLMMVWQAVQPSINPGYLLNHKLDSVVANSGIVDFVPCFELRVNLLAVVDTASLGLFAALALLGGWWAGWRRERTPWNRLSVWAFLAGALGFVLATGQVLPAPIGRVFLGFWLLGVPLAMEGWRHFSDRPLKLAVWAVVGTAWLAIILSPSRPLRPAEALQRWLGGDRAAGVVANSLRTYLLVRERSEAGRGLADQVPDGEPFFVALVTEDRPLLPVLTSRHGPGAVRLMRAQATASELAAFGRCYVLLCDPNRQDYPELADHLANGSTHEPVATATYVSRMDRGPELWTLYAPKPQPEN
jgi:hypothetical protein